MAGEVEMDGDTPKAGRTPPYISYKSFLTLVEELKTNGLPPQIDRSVLRRFSGGLGSQLLMGMKSLGLVGDDNKPTGRGAKLVNAFGTPEWKETLRGVLAVSYPFLEGINLLEATPSMFADAFRKGTGSKEDVLRKSRTFFLHASKDAGVAIGPRILNGSVPRAPSTGATKRKAKAAKATKEEPAKGTDTGHHTKPNTGDDSVAQTLLNKFPTFDPAWSDDLKAKWFDGYAQLLKMGGKDSG